MRTLGRCVVIQALSYVEQQIRNILQSGLEALEQRFYRVLKQLPSKMGRTEHSYAEPEGSTYLIDTDFVLLYLRAIAAGYDQPMAALIAIEFGSEDAIDWVIETLEIKSDEPFQV